MISEICNGDYQKGDKVLIKAPAYKYPGGIWKNKVALLITDFTTNNGNNRGIDHQGHIWHFNSYINDPVIRLRRAK